MELWDIYDINKKKTGRVIDRCSNEKLRKGEYHLVVEAIIINSKGEILICKRAVTKKEYPLKWECIEGSCIKGETSLEAILREIKEEIGINLKKAEAIFYKTIKDDKAKDFKDIWLFRKNDKNLKIQQNLAKVWYNININLKKEMNDYDNETKRII